MKGTFSIPHGSLEDRRRKNSLVDIGLSTSWAAEENVFRLWWEILGNKPRDTETVLKSYSDPLVQNQVELAEDIVRLLQSDGVMEELREFVSHELINETYGDLQGRMSMGDIAGVLDESDVTERSVLNGRI